MFTEEILISILHKLRLQKNYNLFLTRSTIELVQYLNNIPNVYCLASN